MARHGDTLLRVALRSIRHGLEHGRALEVALDDYPPELCALRATFVTLTIEAKLRGCIGKARACRPLVADVAENAYAAAFNDERFAPLAKTEADRIEVKVSVLGDPEPLRFTGESDLRRQLRPGADGVILEHGSRHGLFLPDVWEAMPKPRDFLTQLKVKAKLSPGFWSNDITAKRFTTAATASSKLDTVD